MRTLLAAALLLIAAACGQPSGPKFQLTDVTGAPFGKALALTDHSGKPRTLADFKGKIVVIFFGFTTCPDVCPTTLAELGKVMKELGADADKVQVLLVSVDPERDTPELLKQYVTAFHPSFIALRGDMDATKAAAKEFKVVFHKVQLKTGGYSVEHSAGTFILDTEGRLRLFAQHGIGGQVILNDIRTLLKHPA